MTVPVTTWPTVTPPPYQFYHHLTRHPEGKLNDCPWNNLTNPNTTKAVRETVRPVTVPGTTWPTVTPPPYQFYHHLTRHPEGKLNDCPWNNLTNPNTTKAVRETVRPVTVPGTTWPTVTPPPYQFYHHLTRHPEGKLNDCPWNNLTNPNTTKAVRETVSSVTVHET